VVIIGVFVPAHYSCAIIIMFSSHLLFSLYFFSSPLIYFFFSLFAFPLFFKNVHAAFDAEVLKLFMPLYSHFAFTIGASDK